MFNKITNVNILNSYSARISLAARSASTWGTRMRGLSEEYPVLILELLANRLRRIQIDTGSSVHIPIRSILHRLSTPEQR